MQAVKDSALDSIARKPISETQKVCRKPSLADWLTSKAVQCIVLSCLRVGFCAKGTVCSDRSLQCLGVVSVPGLGECKCVGEGKIHGWRPFVWQSAVLLRQT